MKISRREFLVAGTAGVFMSALAGYAIYRMGTGLHPEHPPGMSEVFMVSALDRAESVKKLLRRFDLAGFGGARVALKANYNSADPFPASTHIDTLRYCAGFEDDWRCSSCLGRAKWHGGHSPRSGGQRRPQASE